MSTSAHNGYVALAKQATRQPKRKELSIKREEALAILADKEARESRIRELEKKLTDALKAERQN